ncbi:hypothetical protein TNCV_912281 [Trichonephila clavipes]|nr:hypothetical protein TNCV_912281 [Trichonephila clavipes]
MGKEENMKFHVKKRVENREGSLGYPGNRVQFIVLVANTTDRKVVWWILKRNFELASLIGEYYELKFEDEESIDIFDEKVLAKKLLRGLGTV